MSSARIRGSVRPLPDVEAVLVRKPSAPRPAYEAVIVPIDACYDLVGRLRLYWRGFSGGDRARGEIERFFNEILARAARSTATRNGARAMSDVFAPGERIADAVMYEGYILYPYRASAMKNRFRWQFGVIAPACRQ